MDAKTIILPSGKGASLAAIQVLTPAANAEPKTVEVESFRTVVFFIGGAGDKELYYFAGPYRNIFYAKESFDRRVKGADKGGTYISHYLGYNEARDSSDIQNFIASKIPDKVTPVYIVGHSLGGWNGAHLSNILHSNGYQVEMLVTLDPVGEGALVWLGSDIYYSKPEPKSGFWINVRANPRVPDSSDSVAEFGERWSISSGPDVNHVMDINHYNARDMFCKPMAEGLSAEDYMFESVVSYMRR
jgi:pimeloyl-ACP methyl ester carboxylesterase